jgi:aminobenzoyl-glutamate utilization protein B
MKNTSKLTFVLLLATTISVQAQKTKSVLTNLDNQKESYTQIAQQIWEWAEMGFLEEKSSALLQETLASNGFKIEKGIAGIPTAFMAEYGTQGPIIAILGEYDALPGLSQEAVTHQSSAGGVAGHACGHHLFGTASTAAAIAVKEWLETNGVEGRVRFYGCPAEEGGSGKVYMVREGVFNDVDAVLHWHPSSQNSASAGAALANKSAKFRFYGVSAHAAAAPDQGKSALDAVEGMNMMVNMLREHIPDGSRIHYVITNGGKAPNVVPNFAEVYYYARDKDRKVVVDIFDKIVNAAKGAAIGTGTTMDYELIGGTHELLPNLTLQKLVYNNLVKVGGYQLDNQENAFAQEISKTLANPKDLGSTNEIQPYKEVGKPRGSTDVGDVSFTVPTAGLGTATWVPGTPAHSWQAVAAGGMSMSKKGMMVAAKTLALSAIDLYKNKKLLTAAKKEFEERRGADFKYVPMIGDRKPALDYRK